MAEYKASETVRQAFSSWEGMTTHDHRFGGVEYSIDNSEAPRSRLGSI